jgi:hypothetical protein
MKSCRERGWLDRVVEEFGYSGIRWQIQWISTADTKESGK